MAEHVVCQLGLQIAVISGVPAFSLVKNCGGLKIGIEFPQRFESQASTQAPAFRQLQCHSLCNALKIRAEVDSRGLR